MEEEKTYTIAGRTFTLKEKFVLKDWEKTLRIDSFFAKIRSGEGRDVIQNVSQDEYTQFLLDILIPCEGEPIKKEEVDELGLEVAHQIFIDFFFIYLENTTGIADRLKSLEERTNLLKEKFGS